MEKYFMIISDYEIDGEFLFWSNLMGWVSGEIGDLFTEKEKEIFNLPFGGKWIEV